MAVVAPIKGTMSEEELRQVELRPVVNGHLVGELVTAGTIFDEAPLTIVFVVRRPGCQVCRAEARELSDLHKSGRLGNARLIGIIKEVAPQQEEMIRADKLGLLAFQKRYFEHPLYVDEKRGLYKALGERKITSLFSWNPIKWYRALKKINARTTALGITGNFNGEGMILGGVLVVSKDNGVIYEYKEITGDPIPIEEIVSAVKSYSSDEKII